MKALAGQERRCLEYAAEAVKTLVNMAKEMCGRNFFLRNVKEGKSFDEEQYNGTNTATGVICQTVRYCRNNLVIRDFHNENWDDLVHLAGLAENTVRTLEPKDVLHFDKLGDLPIFATAVFCKLLASDPVNLGPEATRTLALGMRRILFQLHKDWNASRESERSAGQTHSYSLYLSAMALSCFSRRIGSRNLDGLIAWGEMLEKSEEDLKQIRHIKEKHIPVLIGETKDIKEIWSQMQTATKTCAVPSQYLRHLTTSCTRQLHENLAQCTDGIGPDFDPSTVAFSVLTLISLEGRWDRRLIRSALKALFKSCERGPFDAILPFQTDDRGRAIFVPTVETANALIESLLAMPEEELSEILPQAIEATDLIEELILERQLDVRAPSRGADSEIILKGWCSDRAYEPDRIDSWITAHVLRFLLLRVALIRKSMWNDLAKDFNISEPKNNKWNWGDIVDPDIEVNDHGSEKTPIKDQLLTCLQNRGGRALAPVYMLYGPPGTSKTTIVKAYAAKQGWRLLSLSPSDFINEGLEKVEQRSRKIFEILMCLDQCVILFDEMDTLLVTRDAQTHTVIDHVVPSFLPKLQDLRDYTERRDIAVFFITNFYDRIDQAICRRGRIDNRILILPFNAAARARTLAKIICRRMKKPERDLSKEEYDIITSIANACSGAMVYRELDELAILIQNYLLKPSINGNASNICDLVKLVKCETIVPEAYDRPSGNLRRMGEELLALLNRIYVGRPKTASEARF